MTSRELTLGSIGEHHVRCITAAAQLAAHEGKVDAKDLADSAFLRTLLNGASSLSRQTK